MSTLKKDRSGELGLSIEDDEVELSDKTYQVKMDLKERTIHQSRLFFYIFTDLIEIHRNIPRQESLLSNPS
jgi:hypothetical protein